MRAASRFAVLTSLLGGGFAVACSEAHTARTGADFGPQDAAVVGDASPPRDADGDADAPTIDGIADCAVRSLLSGEACDLGPSPFPETGATRTVACDDALTAPPCTYDATEVVASGSGPDGAVEASGAWVDYSGGFVVGTGLTLTGTQGGFPFHLRLSGGDWDGDDPSVISPGEHDEGVYAKLEWFTADATCRLTDGVPVRLVVDQHVTADGRPEEGDAISLRGSLHVHHEDWAMDVDFELDRSCGFRVSI